MRARAAVAWETGKPFEVLDVDVPDPAEGQVLVRVAAAGLCHTDVSARDGGIPHPLPAILGHEGAGVVEAVGPGVERVAPGDHAALCWMPACRRCEWCLAGQPFLCEVGLAEALSVPPRTCGDRAVLPGLGTAAFAEATLVAERAVVPVPADVPLEVAALVGCAATTGVGAVVNTAGVRAGDTVAVVGCGGVGLSAVMGAAVAGASRVVALDLSDERRAFAAELGATDVVDPRDGDPVEAVHELTGGRGVDHALEVVGSSATIRQAFAMARRGGDATLVGAGRSDDEVRFDAMELFFGAKRILGCVYGSADPDRDFPRLLDLYRAGRLPLDRLVTARIGLDGLEDAAAAMASGAGVRSVVTFD